jgi:hypothetical protein
MPLILAVSTTTASYSFFTPPFRRHLSEQLFHNHCYYYCHVHRTSGIDLGTAGINIDHLRNFLVSFDIAIRELLACFRNDMGADHEDMYERCYRMGDIIHEYSHI